MFKFLNLNQIQGNVIKKKSCSVKKKRNILLCHSCILMIWFKEGCNTKGQETAKKWSVEVETRSVEVERSGRNSKRPYRAR